VRSKRLIAQFCEGLLRLSINGDHKLPTDAQGVAAVLTQRLERRLFESVALLMARGNIDATLAAAGME
jgi:hypothetical protein